MEEREQIFAEPGELLEDFECWFELYKTLGHSALFIYNGVVIDTDSDLSFMDQYEIGMSEREEEYLNSEFMRKEECKEKIEYLMDHFLDFSTINDGVVSEDDIMVLLGATGYVQIHAGIDVDNLDLDKCQDVINLIYDNGYLSIPKEDAYRTGTDAKSDEINVMFYDLEIQCKKDCLPFKESSSELAEFAIRNAMTQLSEGTISAVNYIFAYMYEELKTKERFEKQKTLQK